MRRTDGQSATVETSPHASGSPERPLTDAQLEAKFRDCAANAIRPIPEGALAQAIDRLHHLDRVADVTSLLALFKPTA